MNIANEVINLYRVDNLQCVIAVDYRCNNKSFWLSAHNCQVATPTSQNLEQEQQIRTFGADSLINCLEYWNP